MAAPKRCTIMDKLEYGLQHYTLQFGKKKPNANCYYLHKGCTDLRFLTVFIR